MSKLILLFGLTLICSSQAFAAGGVNPQMIKASQERNKAQSLKYAQEGKPLFVSPYAECNAADSKPQTFLTKADYEKNKEYWDRAKTECSSDVNIEVLADTGFFNDLLQNIKGSVGMQYYDEETLKKAKEFLTVIGEKSKEYATINRKHNEKLAACAPNPDNQSQECKELISNTKAVMASIRPELRQEMALSRYGKNATIGQAYRLDESKERALVINKALQAVDGLPSPNSGYLAVLGVDSATNNSKIPALTPAELAAAQAKFEQDSKDIIAEKNSKGYDDYINKHFTFGTWNMEAPGRSSFDRDKNKVVGWDRYAKQQEHKDKYIKLINQAPLLAYIGSTDPSDKEIIEAAKVFAKNAKDQEDKIALALDNGKKESGGQSSSMYDFLSYGPVIKELLKKDPRFCGAATMLAQYKTSEDLQGTLGYAALAVSGGIAANGLKVAAGAVTRLGAVGSVLSSSGTLMALGSAPGSIAIQARDWNKAKDVGQRFASSMDGKHTLAEMQEYNEAMDNVKMNLLFTPLDFMGAGAMKPVEKSKIILALLKREGVEQATAARLAASVVKQGTEESKLALVEIQKTLKVSPQKKQFFEYAAGRKLIDRPAPGSVLKRPPTQNQVFDEALKSTDAKIEATMAQLKKLDPVMRSDNDKQLVKTLFAGADFYGLDNPNLAKNLVEKANAGVARVAEKSKEFSDNPDSLAGLEKALRLAKKQLDDPKISAIADPVARREAAFQKALKDEEIDEATAKKMCGCAGVCAI